MTEVEVLELLVSPAHRLAGRPSDGPSPARRTSASPGRRCAAVWDWWAIATTHGPPTGTRR